MLFWTTGVAFFLASFSVPVMSDAELQANIVLFIVVPPLAVLGAWVYYRGGSSTPGYALGVLMFAVGGTMDALITVPVFMLPTGVTYVEFYSDPKFWLVGLEIILANTAYWWLQPRPSDEQHSLLTQEIK